MSKTALKYGLIGGAILLIIFGVPHLIWGEPTDYTMGEIIGYTGMVLSMITVFFGIRAFRDKFNGGRISFMKAFGTGAYISIIAGIIFGIYSFVLYAYVMPDFVDKYYRYSVDQLKQSGLPAEEIDAKIKEMESYPEWMKSPVFNGFLMCITVFAIGLLVALISAVILRRENPPGNNKNETVFVN